MNLDKKTSELEIIAKLNYGMSIVSFFLHFPIYIMLMLSIIYYRKSKDTYIRYHFKYQIKIIIKYLAICIILTSLFVFLGFILISETNVKSDYLTAVSNVFLHIKQTVNFTDNKKALEILLMNTIFFLTIIFFSVYYLIIKSIKGWMRLNDKVVP